jgi:hypothetical protein
VSVREQLAEPWGIVAAGLLGGLGGAVTAAFAGGTAALPVAAAIAGLVYGVKVGVATLMSPRRPAPPTAAALPRPPRRSVQEGWLLRAQGAVSTLHQQTESPAEATLRGQICDVDDEAAAAAGDLARLAGQVTLIDQASSRINVGRLREEYARIQASLRDAPGASGGRAGPANSRSASGGRAGSPNAAGGDLRAERERALRAVGDQLEVVGRLSEARESLLARMQSAVLGLEGLVARMAELLALHATTGGGSLTEARLAELTGDLEGMRAGLAEVEALSRSKLRGAAGDPGSGETPKFGP